MLAQLAKFPFTGQSEPVGIAHFSQRLARLFAPAGSTTARALPGSLQASHLIGRRPFLHRLGQRLAPGECLAVADLDLMLCREVTAQHSLVGRGHPRSVQRRVNSALDDQLVQLAVGVVALLGQLLQFLGVLGLELLAQGVHIAGCGGGFLGLARKDLRDSQLLNGIPVEVDTVEWGGGSLIASKVSLKSRDLRTAQMIHNATDQRFLANEAATEALRGRVANIDDYNVKGVTNVYFDTNEYDLSPEARANLCSAAQQADATDNALLLVVGYTDSTGSYEVNQDLSEKRATRVVNYLQQQCGWQPYRMMTPTGMAEADPAADNTTDYGKAQNRRVAVNILVSKSVDGI